MTALLREVIGDVLRNARTDQGRTLREVSDAARVSLGYLSEVERGRKEASSELLSAICDALDVPLSRVLTDAGESMARREHDAREAEQSRWRTSAASMPRPRWSSRRCPWPSHEDRHEDRREDQRDGGRDGRLIIPVETSCRRRSRPRGFSDTRYVHRLWRHAGNR